MSLRYIGYREKKTILTRELNTQKGRTDWSARVLACGADLSVALRVAHLLSALWPWCGPHLSLIYLRMRDMHPLKIKSKEVVNFFEPKYRRCQRAK